MDVIEKENNAHSMDVNCVKFNPGYGLLASACDDGTIAIWRLNQPNDILMENS